MRIAFLQIGNFADGYKRLQAGEAETYRDQRNSVSYVAELAKRHDVTVISVGDGPHDIQVSPGLRSVRVTWERFDAANLLGTTTPDAFIARMPHRGMMLELKRRRIRSLPCFADIFSTRGFRPLYRSFRMAQALKGPHITCVSNHSLNASQSMETALGVPRDRIVPWDWSHVPVSPEAKESVAHPATPRLFFAGSMIPSKGIPDCLAAAARLRDQGITASLEFAGGGKLDYWRAEAERLNLGDRVTFLGLIPNAEVRARMQASDIILVPSWHEYPEGLPNTIYEGLASRAALVISDHPAFAGRLRHERDCLIFRAQDSKSLATAIARLCREPALYAALSLNSEAAVNQLYVGLEWSNLIDLYLDDPDDRTGWVTRNSLATLLRQPSG